MYRSALRHEIWNTLPSSSGYVCLHCRHRLAAKANRVAQKHTYAKSQVRHESTQASTETGASGADFFEGFNDLSEEYFSKSPAKSREEKKPSKKERKADASDALSALAARTGVDDNTAKGTDFPSLRLSLEKKIKGNEDGDSGESSEAKTAFARQDANKPNRRARRKAARDQAEKEGKLAVGGAQEVNSMERLRAQLAASAGDAVASSRKKSDENPVGAKKAAKSQTTAQSSAQKRERSQREQFESIMASLEKPREDLTASSAVAETATPPSRASAHPAAKEQSKTSVVKSQVDLSKLGSWERAEYTHAPAEPIVEDDAVEEYEGADQPHIAVDKIDVPSAAPSSAAPEPRKRIEKPDFPFPAQSSIISSVVKDDVPVSAGIISAQQNKTENQGQNKITDQSAKGFYRTYNWDSSEVEKVYQFSPRRDPQSLLARADEVKNRPDWGGVPSPSLATNTAPRASFQSLRDADKVSPPKPKARTAGEAVAWGSEPVLDGDVAFGMDSPADIAEVEEASGSKAGVGVKAADGLVKKSENSKGGGKAKSWFSSFTSPTFADLKRKLGMDVGQAKKQEDGTEAGHDGTEARQDQGVHQNRVVNSDQSETDTPKGSATPTQPHAGEDVTTQPKPTPKFTKRQRMALQKASAKETAVESTSIEKASSFKGIRKLETQTPDPTRSLASASRREHARGVYNMVVARERRLKARSRHDEKMAARSSVEASADTSSKAATDAGHDGMERLLKLHEGKKEGAVADAEVKMASPRPGEVSEMKVKRKGGRSRTVPAKTPCKQPSAGTKPEPAPAQPASSKAEEPSRPLPEAIGSSSEGDVPLPEEPALEAPAPYQPPAAATDIRFVTASDLEVKALNIEQPPVPPLQYGLDRVLFNQGVYQLQDSHSRVYNFDPYLQKVMPISDFNFNALKEYKTSSQDVALAQIAKEHGKKYVGSTSSMTSTLAHFHYLLSNWRPLNLNMLSRGFKDELATYTAINRTPNAIFLRYKQDSNTYAIDADKEFDTPNVLMMLGKSMEKLLTLPKEAYERYRIPSNITDAEKNEPEAFEYTTMGDFLMRSQLDAYDARLPGTGMFDLKTRAALPIRMDAEGYEQMLGYEIFTLQGSWESYEREYYDMMRSTMLKYMLQARMGRMDGIFVAYHNIERIFGFQYLPIAEIDRAIHGQIDPALGDQEFRTSLNMLNQALEMATERFPQKSLRFHFEAIEKGMPMMWIFAEPMEESEIQVIQSRSKKKIREFEERMMGIEHTETEAGRGDVVTTSEGTEKATAVSSSEADVTTPAEDDATPDYTSSTSPADPKFHSKISKDNEDWHRPLFAATLILMNYVNGQPCPDNRPKDLKPGDKWEVQYILKEAPLEPAEKWARYHDCKARRRKVLERAASTTEDGDEEVVVNKKEEWYFNFLQKMVERGRTFRKTADKLEEGKDKVVVGMPGASTSMGSEIKGGADDRLEEGVSVGVESVAGYMDWLYKHQERN